MPRYPEYPECAHRPAGEYVIPCGRCDPDGYIAGHVLAGRMTNGPAWRNGREEIASFCSCGLTFYGGDLEQADAMLFAHERAMGVER